MSALDKSLEELIKEEAQQKEEESSDKPSNDYGRFLRGSGEKHHLRSAPYSFYPDVRSDGTGGTAAGSRDNARPAQRRERKRGGAQPQQRQQSGRYTYFGIVRSFNAAKGWGFLECEELGSEDVFVHRSECDTSIISLDIGDEVQFQLANSSDGDLQARLVNLIAKVVAYENWYPSPQMATSQRHDSYRPPQKLARGGQSRRTTPWLRIDESRSLPPSAASQRPARAKLSTVNESPLPSPRSSVVPNAIAKSGNRARVRVMNVPRTFTWKQLWEAFEVVGDILSVEMDKERVGEGVVTFRSEEAAMSVVDDYDGGLLDDQEISVVLQSTHERESSDID